MDETLQDEEEKLWQRALLEILDAKNQQIRNAYKNRRLSTADMEELIQFLEVTRELILTGWWSHSYCAKVR